MHKLCLRTMHSMVAWLEYTSALPKVVDLLIYLLCFKSYFSAIQTMLVSAETQEGYITTINSSNFNSSFPHQAIQIPLELVRLFTDSNVHDSGEVRVIASFFNNVEDLFPKGRPGINKYD